MIIVSIDITFVTVVVIIKFILLLLLVYVFVCRPTQKGFRNSVGKAITFKGTYWFKHEFSAGWGGA